MAQAPNRHGVLIVRSLGRRQSASAGSGMHLLVLFTTGYADTGVLQSWDAALLSHTQQTVQRSRSCHRTLPSSAPRRRGPIGALSDAALAAAIKAVLAASPFHGEGHRKVWVRLRYAGIRTSLRRVLRLMREHDLLAPGRVGSPRGPRSHMTVPSHAHA
jgi:HTH-like domain